MHAKEPDNVNKTINTSSKSIIRYNIAFGFDAVMKPFLIRSLTELDVKHEEIGNTYYSILFYFTNITLILLQLLEVSPITPRNNASTEFTSSVLKTTLLVCSFNYFKNFVTLVLLH